MESSSRITQEAAKKLLNLTLKPSTYKATLGFFLILFFTPFVFSSTKQKLERLSTNSTWIKLNHYKKRFGGTYKSNIKNKDFFLHPEGYKNPLLELTTIYNSFLANENSIICRFPARKMWLDSHFENIKAVKISCPDYEKWAKEKDLDSISVIFATGFLSNPASYYGHILLRFNSKQNTQTDTDLLDLSLNYGAAVPPGENGLVYVLRGLFGGYKAAFSYNSAYNHNHNYAVNDLRDLWEYQLNLSPQKNLLLLKYAWEVKQAKFTYYFLKQNCGFKMLEFLELVSEKKLFSKKPPYALPILVVNQTSKHNLLGQVSKFHPCNQNFMNFTKTFPTKKLVL